MRLIERENEIFYLYKNNKKINFRDIAQKLEISLGTVHKDVQKLINKKFLEKQGNTIYAIKDLDKECIDIPYYGEVQAGTTNRLVDDTPEKNIPISKDLIFGNTKNLFLVKAEGNSMEPNIKEGAMLLCEWNKKDVKSLNGKVVIVITELDGVKVKKLDLKQKAFVSFNDNFPNIDISIEDRIIGEVKQIISQPL